MRRRAVDRCQRLIHRLGWSFGETGADGPGGFWNIDASRGEPRVIARAESRTAAWNELLRLVVKVMRQS